MDTVESSVVMIYLAHCERDRAQDVRVINIAITSLRISQTDRQTSFAAKSE